MFIFHREMYDPAKQVCEEFIEVIWACVLQGDKQYCQADVSGAI